MNTQMLLQKDMDSYVEQNGISPSTCRETHSRGMIVIRVGIIPAQVSIRLKKMGVVIMMQPLNDN